MWIYLVCAIVAVLVLLLLTLFGAAVYSGLLHDIQIGVGKPHISDVTVAYKFDRSPYKNCGYLFSEAHSLAPKLRCICVFYDDPHPFKVQTLRRTRWLLLSMRATLMKILLPVRAH